MSQRDDDIAMLDELLDKHLHELTERQVEAFSDMRFDLKAYPKDIAERHGFRNLNDKQRDWVTSVHRQLVPRYENVVSRGLIQEPKKPGERGYVALMVGALPKKPPPLPKEPGGPKRVTAEHQPFRVSGLDEKDEDE